jgi:hypothetical protein
MIRILAVSLAAGLVSSWAPAQTQSDTNHERALQVLRKVMMDERQRTGASTGTRAPTFEDLERMYLDGKITAKQFHRYVDQYKLQRPKPGPTNAIAAKAPPPRPPTGTPPGLTNAPAAHPPEAENPNAAALDRLSEVEAKWDAILREKAERDKARTNATTATSGKMTKRDRLNVLLKQRIEGKLTEEQYRQEWDKIAAEPE